MIAFAKARLDEDEARATAALAEWDQNAMEWEDLPDASYAHARWHDPARVLREVAAVRAVIATYERSVRMVGESLSVPDRKLTEAFAAVWSDHPDYQASWKP
jgi:hypothetical protein